ncbi:hypothetical protein G6F59_016844 [Rhizopus arrhizus]|nr:hypothetical protein G6F59_016844 [Rhizopus arrhizus]
MHQRQLRIGDLAYAAFAAQLPDGFDHDEDAVHAGMHAAQAAAVGVHRQPAARRDGPVCDEVLAFALGAEAQVFQEEQGIDGEGVVQFDHVDVFLRHARHVEGALARFGRGRHGQVFHGRELPVPDRGGVAQRQRRL